MAKEATIHGTLILGAPRSGTTLLRRIIDAHPECACPGETSIFVGAAKLIRKDRGAIEVDVGLLSGLSYAGFSESEILHRIRRFAFAFLEDYALRAGKEMWIEKTAFNAFYIKEIEHICDNEIRYICLVRHGLDVACSIKELCDVNGGYLAELHDYIRRFPAPLEAFCRAWSDVTNEILDLCRRRPTQTLMVQYEALVSEPELCLRQVFKFLGANWEDGLMSSALKGSRNLGLGDWKTYGKDTIDTGSIGRWERLSRSTVSSLADIVNPVLARCGYEEIETLSPTDKHHRYRMGLMVQQLKKEL